MLGGCAGLLLNWACQGTCACEPWGREKPKRTAPGEALVSRHRTRVQFPPPPPLRGGHVTLSPPSSTEGRPVRGTPFCRMQAQACSACWDCSLGAEPEAASAAICS